MTIAELDNSLINIRGRVARVLLERANDNGDRQNRVTHRDMATMLNTDWHKINLSLRSLHEEGAIKIHRHRIIIETATLQRLAGMASKTKGQRS